MDQKPSELPIDPIDPKSEPVHEPYNYYNDEHASPSDGGPSVLKLIFIILVDTSRHAANFVVYSIKGLNEIIRREDEK